MESRSVSNVNEDGNAGAPIQAMVSGDSVFVSVPMFNGKTFNHWNFQIDLIFKNRNVDEFVNKSASE